MVKSGLVGISIEVFYVVLCLTNKQIFYNEVKDVELFFFFGTGI